MSYIVDKANRGYYNAIRRNMGKKKEDICRTYSHIKDKIGSGLFVRIKKGVIKITPIWLIDTAALLL